MWSTVSPHLTTLTANMELSAVSIYPKQFYVYMYLREDGTPYYIGKGANKRAWSKQRRIKKPEDESRIAIHTEDLTEDQAFALEMELIDKYGRKDNGTGILRNLTDGGEGNSGRTMTETHRQRIANAKTGLKATQEAKESMSNAQLGKKHSEETRRKMSKSHTGKIRSDDHNKKLGKARMKPCVIDGVLYESAKHAAQALGIPYQRVTERLRRPTTLGWEYI